MKQLSRSPYSILGWLDSLAVSMAFVCAIHCLVSPILISLLPVLSATFFLHKDFHLWLILLAIPTTVAAVYSGCSKHKDKLVLSLSGIGLALLFSVAVYESWLHSGVVVHTQMYCPLCAQKNRDPWSDPLILINLMGGLSLASAHVRNYCLCRKQRCQHEMELADADLASM